MALLNSIEKIFLQSANTNNGWTKTTFKNERCRTIKIGNTINCNGDIIKNYSIIDNINTSLQKYNINNYNIQEIDTDFEFSYQLYIPEMEYKALIIALGGTYKEQLFSNQQFCFN